MCKIIVYLILQEYLLLFKDKKERNRFQDTDPLQRFPVGVSKGVWQFAGYFTTFSVFHFICHIYVPELLI